MKYIFLFLFFHYIYCYLEIPLKYLPIYKCTNSTPNDIYNSIINIKLYTELSVGTPKQSIEVPLDFTSNDFYISDNPIEYFNKNNNLFSNIHFFDSTKSISLFPLEDIYLDGNNFYLGEYSQDVFYLNNNTKTKLEFYLPIKLKKAESGGIGLLLYTSKFNSDRTFLKCIKKKGLIDNYYWNIIHKDDDDIFLLLGNLPHEINHTLINNKNLNKDDIKSIHYEIENGNTKYSINVDNIILMCQNKTQYNLNDIKKIELNYNSGGIKLPNHALPLFEKFLEPYTSGGDCFKNELDMPIKIYFFYCKNEEIIIDNIRQNFPDIKFYSSDLNFEFDLDMNDLFYIKDKFIYFLMFFENDSSINRIIVGKPFLKKYQFFFEPDKKLIYFYSTKNITTESNNNTISNKENKKYIFIIIIIICSLILVLAFVFFLFKFFLKKYMNRAKKAYELEDEYEKKKKNDKGLIINGN